MIFVDDELSSPSPPEYSVTWVVHGWKRYTTRVPYCSACFFFLWTVNGRLASLPRPGQAFPGAMTDSGFILIPFAKSGPPQFSAPLKHRPTIFGAFRDPALSGPDCRMPHEDGLHAGYSPLSDRHIHRAMGLRQLRLTRRSGTASYLGPLLL